MTDKQPDVIKHRASTNKSRRNISPTENQKITLHLVSGMNISAVNVEPKIGNYVEKNISRVTSPQSIVIHVTEKDQKVKSNEKQSPMKAFGFENKLKKHAKKQKQGGDHFQNQYDTINTTNEVQFIGKQVFTSNLRSLKEPVEQNKTGSQEDGLRIKQKPVRRHNKSNLSNSRHGRNLKTSSLQSDSFQTTPNKSQKQFFELTANSNQKQLKKLPSTQYMFLDQQGLGGNSSAESIQIVLKREDMTGKMQYQTISASKPTIINQLCQEALPIIHKQEKLVNKYSLTAVKDRRGKHDWGMKEEPHMFKFYPDPEAGLSQKPRKRVASAKKSPNSRAHADALTFTVSPSRATHRSTVRKGCHKTSLSLQAQVPNSSSTKLASTVRYASRRKLTIPKQDSPKLDDKRNKFIDQANQEAQLRPFHNVTRTQDIRSMANEFDKHSPNTSRRQSPRRSASINQSDFEHKMEQQFERDTLGQTIVTMPNDAIDAVCKELPKQVETNDGEAQTSDVKLEHELPQDSISSIQDLLNLIMLEGETFIEKGGVRYALQLKSDQIEQIQQEKESLQKRRSIAQPLTVTHGLAFALPPGQLEIAKPKIVKHMSTIETQTDDVQFFTRPKRHATQDFEMQTELMNEPLSLQERKSLPIEKRPPFNAKKMKIKVGVPKNQVYNNMGATFGGTDQSSKPKQLRIETKPEFLAPIREQAEQDVEQIESAPLPKKKKQIVPQVDISKKTMTTQVNFENQKGDSSPKSMKSLKSKIAIKVGVKSPNKRPMPSSQTVAPEQFSLNYLEILEAAEKEISPAFKPRPHIKVKQLKSATTGGDNTPQTYDELGKDLPKASGVDKRNSISAPLPKQNSHPLKGFYTKQQLYQKLEETDKYIQNEQAVSNIMCEKQKKRQLHVGFLFASPIKLTDKNVHTQKYNKTTPIAKVKEALFAYYKKQGLNEEEMEQRIKQDLPDITKNKDLSDNTRIDSLPWRQLKTLFAMEENYEEFQQFSKYSEKDKKLLIRLREAQKEQGNMQPLRSQHEDSEYQQRVNEQTYAMLTEYEKKLQKQSTDYSTDFLGQLNFQTEMKVIKNKMKESGYQLAFKGCVATTDNFDEMMGASPKVLHISCHGLKVETTKSIFVEQQKDKENCLLFETPTGEGHLITSARLTNMIRVNMPSLDVVILAACDSEFIGKIFLKSGAKHVICVKDKRYVKDEAAIDFTKTFYQRIFQGKSVCESFDMAKIAVELQHSSNREADLFTIFTSEQAGELQEPHDHDNLVEFYKTPEHRDKCRDNLMGNLEEGNAVCKSEHVLIKQIPAKILNLQFRDKDLMETINHIMSGERFIMILGLHGVGKSSVARNALHYINERKYMTGGVMWVQLKGTKDVYAILKQIQSFIYRALILSRDEIAELTRDTCREKDLESFIIEFLNNPMQSKYASKLRRANLHKKQNSDFLICFDNCEELIETRQKAFQMMIKKFLDCCSNLRIVVTSNKWIDQMSNIVHPRIQYLHQLKTKSAVELFFNTLQKSGFSWTSQNVYDMIIADRVYPIRKMVSKHRTKKIFPDQMTDTFNRKMLTLLNGRDRQVEALSYHDLFKQLSGNPTSIVILASALANRLIHCSTFAELYKSALYDGKNIFENEEEDDENISSRSPRANELPSMTKNNFSLQFTIDTSIKLLIESTPKVINLFYFLGCLPGGVVSAQLQELWIEPDETLDMLNKMSFLEKGVDKILLTTNLIMYVEMSIKAESKAKHMNLIAEYYIKILEEFYTVNSGEQSHHSRKTETNVSEFHCGEILEHQCTTVKTPMMKSVFEKVIHELRNIEHALNYFIAYAESNKRKRFSRIMSNESINLKSQNVTIVSKTPNEKISPQTSKSSQHQQYLALTPNNNNYNLTEVRVQTKLPAVRQAYSNDSYDTIGMHIKGLQPIQEREDENISRRDSPKSIQSGKKTPRADFSPGNSEVHSKSSEGKNGNTFDQFHTQPSKALGGMISGLNMNLKIPKSPPVRPTKSETSPLPDNANAHHQDLELDLKCLQTMGARQFSFEGFDSEDELTQTDSQKSSETRSDIPAIGVADLKSQSSLTGGAFSPMANKVMNYNSFKLNTEKHNKNEADREETFTGFQDLNEIQDNRLRRRNNTVDTRSDFEYDQTTFKRTKTTKFMMMAREIEKNVFKLRNMNNKAVDIQGSAIVKSRRNDRSFTKHKKVRRANSLRENRKDDEQMTIPGHFILLFCANIFLSSDFEYCLRITQKNFSYVENTSLFEGNILRFRSLAADELFYHKDDWTISEHQIFLNRQNLFTALESAENALSIYEDRKDDIGTLNNVYGQALQEFQLGYLYQRYSIKLIDPQTKEYSRASEDHYAKKTIFKDLDVGYRKAIELFQKAAKHFKRIDHYYGLWLSKKHESELFESYGDCFPQGMKLMNEKSKQEKDKVRSKVMKYKAKFDKHVEENGTKHCPHIMRRHGHEISLMTEIVYENSIKSLFVDERETVESQADSLLKY